MIDHVTTDREHCPHGRSHQECSRCTEWPDWWADLAYRLIRIEHQGERNMLDLTALRTAVDQNSSDIASAIDALGRLSAHVGDGGTVTQEDIDSITSSLQSAHQAITTAVTADAPPTAPVDPAPVSDPTPPTPNPVDPPVTPELLPLYSHAGPGTFDTSVWPLASVTALDGSPLYNFVGDVAGGTATGAGEAWVPYTGATS